MVRHLDSQGQGPDDASACEPYNAETLTNPFPEAFELGADSAGRPAADHADQAWALMKVLRFDWRFRGPSKRSRSIVPSEFWIKLCSRDVQKVDFGHPAFQD